MAPRRLSTPASGVERAGLALTLGVLVFAAVAGLVRLTDPGTAASATPLASERQAAATVHPARTLPPRVADGRVLQHVADAGFSGVVLDATDRSLLHVVVPQGPRPVDCNLIDPAVRVSTQNTTVVRLVVSGYRYVPASTARSGRGGTTCISVGSRSIPVRLAAPLGDRHVHAGSDPASTAVADPTDLPRITRLPAGYRQRTVEPVTTVASNGPADAGEPGRVNLVAERTYATGPDRLVVRVGSQYDLPVTGAQAGTATVEGSYATVTQTRSARCVTWTELSGRVRQVCSHAAAPLPTSTLLNAARSLAG